MAFQLGATLLDACVLAVLSSGDAYGYVLTQKIQGLIEISESTLYPVLRRLLKENLLVTYDSPFQGRNRRYYQITAAGRVMLTEYQTQWTDYKAKVDPILFGGNSDEQE